MTRKEQELIELAHQWGYCTLDDVTLFLEVAKSTASERLKRLVSSNKLKMTQSRLGVNLYHLGKMKFNISDFDHDRKCKELCKHILGKLDCEYIGGAKLRSLIIEEKGRRGLTEKIPDFVITFQGKSAAIEVELSQKSLKRQEENIWKYVAALRNGEYFKVVYYCGSEEIRDRVLMLASDKVVRDYIEAKMMPL
ncbi:hypothetical protein [Fundidesulfovibrio putealis]|uniref:hypothetical protein n=1 Tax=Fundidesulfovibrio putealis TaxID=270496 RepID=UPI00040C6CAA|nr:hypothetical protein [Fundidesulfovibrio putealis]KAF0234890.1 MAG: hypothetical protein FD177_453 [Desulfovibrionaceae bacterium]